MDITAILKAKLNVGDNVVAFHEGVMSPELSSNAHRLLALVERNSSYGLFIFTMSRNPPQTFTDLTINFVIPIDNNFICEIEPAESNSVIYINKSANNLKLYIKMDSGKQTNNFFTELSKSMNLYLKNEHTLDFQWLEKYNKNDINIALDLMMNINGDNTTANGIPNKKLPLPMISPSNSRETVVQRQMLLYEGKYTEEKNVIIYIGTWNVNGQTASTSLSDWLLVDSEPPDIYAIGFQELDLSKEAYLFNDSPREEEWLQAVTNCLKPEEYKKISLVRLVGMMLIVFVKHEHTKFVENVATDSVGTGILGKLGNKGGVALRMDFHNTSMCFVNTHLAAHVEEYERRNQDYHNICSRIVFSISNKSSRTIKDHNQVYWFGDLNYRITEMDAPTVKKLVNVNEFDSVLKADQLKQQHRGRKVFEGYKEGPINFLPTYKYDTGTSEWDSSEKNRAPAWCDRILWHGNSIKQLAYRSHPKLLISDHKPVSALFQSKVKVVDANKAWAIHESIMKELDKKENEYLPQVMVDSTEIVFNNVQFMEPQIKELTVANTGQVPVQFEFINKLDERYCKEWLHIQPYTSFIEPGTKCDITLEVLVDKSSAYKMNNGQDKLYNILVLHLEGGKDIFITVTGTYEHSCFGCSLETLCYLKVPVKDITPEKLMELENNNSNLNLDPYPVPKEVWYLVDHLYRHGLKEEHLFEQSGLRFEFIQIRNWLDNGTPDALPGSVHSVAEALLILLDSTSEPIIPYNFHQACLSASSYDQCIKIISRLPERRKNVFIYLCAFLQELKSHVKDNNIDIKTIASVFGEIFIRDPPKSRSDKSGYNRTPMSRKKTNFVYHFLVNDQSDLISTSI